MSYCVNPACPSPENPDHAYQCQACGSSLLLRDRYRAHQTLGQGGFGATFLAKDESLPGQPICVIKQLRPASNSPHVLEMARELFEREAKTLGKIGNHPQIPRLLDYFEHHREFYLVQDYVSGPTLKQEVKRNGPFTEFGVKQFLVEILPVVQYLHENKVIHRDIKPANIIRRDIDNKLVMIDFGAVKDHVSQTVMLNSSEMTALTSYAIGTPGFAPPEQMSLRPVFASDIYALGVTAIYLLTAKSPKNLGYDPTTGELIWRDYIDVSKSFADIVQKMLEVSVRHRYQSATEVLKALDLDNHHDTLADSMVMYSQGNPAPRDQSGSSEPSLSPTAKAAREIRARKERTTATSILGDSGRPRPVSDKTAPLTTGNGKGGMRVKSPPLSGKLDGNTVRSTYLKGRRDFAGCDLKGVNLQRSVLAEAVFHQANLTQANLQEADLSKANLGRASLSRAHLRDAILNKAYLSYANLEFADLRGADLTEAYMTYANLRGANLCGANLTGCNVTEEQLAMAKTNWLTVKPNGKRGFL